MKKKSLALVLTLGLFAMSSFPASSSAYILNEEDTTYSEGLSSSSPKADLVEAAIRELQPEANKNQTSLQNSEDLQNSENFLESEDFQKPLEKVEFEDADGYFTLIPLEPITYYGDSEENANSSAAIKSSDVESMSITSDFVQEQSEEAIMRPAALGVVQYGLILSSANSKVTYGAAVLSVTGTKPTSARVNVFADTANFSLGAYSRYSTTIFPFTAAELKAGSYKTKQVAIPSTKWWELDGSGYTVYPDGTALAIDVSGGVLNSGVLINKVGVKYPSDYRDPQSGIKMWNPPANLNVIQRTPISTYRSDFINYYNANYSTPRYFGWNDVQIHHMRPLKYNGPDRMDNFIPLWWPGRTPQNGIMSHTTMNNWWLQY